MPKSSEPAIKQLPPKPNLRVAEVAEFLDCNPETIYELIRNGAIPAFRMRRNYRIPRDKFIAIYQRLTVESDE